MWHVVCVLISYTRCESFPYYIIVRELNVTLICDLLHHSHNNVARGTVQNATIHIKLSWKILILNKSTEGLRRRVVIVDDFKLLATHRCRFDSHFVISNTAMCGSSPDWLRSLTSNHTPIAVVGSNLNVRSNSFKWRSYPAGILAKDRWLYPLPILV